MIKYRYHIRLTEKEATELQIKLREPIMGRYPKSTDWEIFTINNETYITPAIFIHTRKFQWEMYPSFEWRADIITSTPLNLDGAFFETTKLLPLRAAGVTHCPVLRLKRETPSTISSRLNCFKWDPKVEYIRGYHEK